MAIVKQFFIILTVSLIGEAAGYFIPLPIPGSIYGLILMFFALHFKIFKVSSVKETGKFLIDTMPLMFVPPGVGILGCLDVLKAHWWQIVLIAFSSTLVVMAVSGLVTQLIMKLKDRRC
ncbi:MAG: CidA/LrgA family protein [Treponema sp.]|nr:CidA/LrgA family protein [Candidatus Treponema equifaecale]